jgi:RNA polymerase sigma-70 factor, ECF subfamily
VDAIPMLMATDGPPLRVGESASTLAQDPDAALVERARAGDAQAFGELVERHRRAVYRAVFAALGSGADADDVAQDAFVSAYQKLPAFRGDASFKTWVLSIAWRKALDRRRSVARWMRNMVARDASSDSVDLVETLASPDRAQDDVLSGHEMRQQIRRLLRTLPRKLRDALLLAGCGDYSYDQIGRMLGIPVGTVKWRVSEARRILKMKLTAMGYAED